MYGLSFIFNSPFKKAMLLTLVPVLTIILFIFEFVKDVFKSRKVAPAPFAVVPLLKRLLPFILASVSTYQVLLFVSTLQKEYVFLFLMSSLLSFIVYCFASKLYSCAKELLIAKLHKIKIKKNFKVFQ